MTWIPVIAAAIGFATLVLRAIRELGWKRELQQRDEFLALSDFEQERLAHSTGRPLDGAARREALTDAAHVLQLDITAPALRSARKKAKRYLSSPTRRRVPTLAAAILVAAFSTIGLSHLPLTEGPLLSGLAVFFNLFIHIATILAVVVEFRDHRHVPRDRPGTRARLLRVASIGSPLDRVSIPSTTTADPADPTLSG